MKTDLIIDGHSLMQVAARTSTNILFNNKSTNFNTIDDLVIEDEGNLTPISDFKRLYHNFLIDYLNSITKCLSHHIEHLFVVFDSGQSWRYNFSDTYKIDRKNKRSGSSYESKINCVFSIFREDIISLIPNINTLSVNTLEGDDLISLIIKYRRDRNYIIWSKDNDLKQLINYHYYPHNIDNTVMLMSPNKSKNKKQLFIAPNLSFTESELTQHSNSELHSLINNIESNGFVSKYCHSEHILVEKIIKGDKSDSINNVYRQLTDYSKAQATRIINKNIIQPLYAEFTANELINFNDNVINRILELIRPHVSNTENLEIIKTNLYLNKKLVQLHPQVLNKELIQDFKNQFNQLNIKQFNYHQDLANKIKRLKYKPKNNPLSRK